METFRRILTWEVGDLASTQWGKNPPWSEFISYRLGEDRKLRSSMVSGGLTLCAFLPLSLSPKLEQRAEARGQNGVGAPMEHVVESSRAPSHILHAVWAGKKRNPRPECVLSQCPAPETCAVRPTSRLPGPGEGPRGQEGPLAGAGRVELAVSVSTPQGRGRECAAPSAARVRARPAWRSGADRLPPKAWPSLLSK